MIRIFFQESSTISNLSILKNPLFFGLILLTNFYKKKYYSFTSRIILYIAKRISLFMPKRTQAEHNLIQKPGVQKIEGIYFTIKSGNRKHHKLVLEISGRTIINIAITNNLVPLSLCNCHVPFTDWLCDLHTTLHFPIL